MSAPRERFCWFCGDSLGTMESKDYHPLDTCGATECQRAAAQAQQDDRAQAHEDLDRDFNF